MSRLIKRVFNKLGIYRVYTVSINEKKVKIPIFNKLGFANLKLPEFWMQEVLHKLGGEKSIFLDVGVNVGQTLLRWKVEYPYSEYVGVEPNTDCVYYANKLIAENNFKNSIILPFALGEEQDLNYLYVKPRDPSDSTASTIKNFRENEDRAALPIILMPYSLFKDKKFDIIKIDVEGGELAIIKSIFNQPKCESVFICEILPVYKKNNKARLDRQIELQEVLKKNEYIIFRIEKGNKIILKEIDEIGIHGDLEACDYVFCPKNKKDVIVNKFL